MAAVCSSISMFMLALSNNRAVPNTGVQRWYFIMCKIYSNGLRNVFSGHLKMGIDIRSVVIDC